MKYFTNFSILKNECEYHRIIDYHRIWYSHDNYPYRSCMAGKEHLAKYNKGSDFILRNGIDHDDHLSTVMKPNMTKKATEFWQKNYKVNGRSYSY